MKNALPNEAVRTLIQVVREAKAACRRDIAINDGISSRTREAYQVALVALSGDRVLETIEAMIDAQETEETNERIDQMFTKYMMRSA